MRKYFIGNKKIFHYKLESISLEISKVFHYKLESISLEMGTNNPDVIDYK